MAPSTTTSPCFGAASATMPRAESLSRPPSSSSAAMDHAPRVCARRDGVGRQRSRRPLPTTSPNAQRRALDQLDRAIVLAAERDLPRTSARACAQRAAARRARSERIWRRVAARSSSSTACSVTSSASVTTTTEPVVVPSTEPPTTASPPARPRAPTGDSVETITNDGIERRYLLHVPTDLPVDRVVPLVLVLHGAGGDPEDIEAGSGWNAVADERGMVIAYPEGDGGDWNAGACCGVAVRGSHDDVGFLEALDRSSRRLRADRSGARRARRPLERRDDGLPARVRSQREGARRRVGGRHEHGGLPTVASPVVHGDPRHRRSGRALQGRLDARERRRRPSTAHAGRGLGHLDGRCARMRGHADEATVRRPRRETWSRCRDRRRPEFVTLTGAGHSWPTGRSFDATSAIADFFFGRPRLDGARPATTE